MARKKKPQRLNQLSQDLQLQIVSLRTEILRQSEDPITKNEAQCLAVVVLRGEGTYVPKLTCEGKKQC